MTLTKNGQALPDLETWSRLAGPKSPDQWVAGRSAMEAARAWVGLTSPALPSEIGGVLASHPDFGTVISWAGEPEVKLRFDDFGGEPRNTDLLVIAHDEHGAFLLAVEAKADEAFAETVAKTACAALEAKVANPRSNAVARIEQLACTLFSERESRAPRLGDLRYQLLTATAGALAEGRRRGIDRVVLLIHEFETDLTRDELHTRNAADLDAFVQRLSKGSFDGVKSGTLLGPIPLPGHVAGEGATRLYIGKAVRRLRMS